MTDATTPPLNKRQIAKAKTQERIKAAAAALFDEVGYEAATIRAIAKKAGMSTGAVFANWDDKASLWVELMKCPPPRDGALYRAGPELLAVAVALINAPLTNANALVEAKALAEAAFLNATTPLPFEVANAG